MANKVYRKTLYNTPTEKETMSADGGNYKSKKVLSISADQVGGGKGRRYYSGEASSRQPSMARTKADMRAKFKMTTAPQDSIPQSQLTDYFKSNPVGKKAKKKKSRFNIFKKKK